MSRPLWACTTDPWAPSLRGSAIATPPRGELWVTAMPGYGLDHLLMVCRPWPRSDEAREQVACVVLEEVETAACLQVGNT